jgi:hypothetical protein
MNYNLKYKNPEGSKYKWSSAGNLKPNQYDNLQVGLQISRIKEAIEYAERQNKTWVNLSCFAVEENTPQNQHSVDKGNAFVADIDDEIPF